MSDTQFNLQQDKLQGLITALQEKLNEPTTQYDLGKHGEAQSSRSKGRKVDVRAGRAAPTKRKIGRKVKIREEVEAKYWFNQMDSVNTTSRPILPERQVHVSFDIDHIDDHDLLLKELERDQQAISDAEIVDVAAQSESEIGSTIMSAGFSTDFEDGENQLVAQVREHLEHNKALQERIATLESLLKDTDALKEEVEKVRKANGELVPQNEKLQQDLELLTLKHENVLHARDARLRRLDNRLKELDSEVMTKDRVNAQRETEIRKLKNSQSEFQSHLKENVLQKVSTLFMKVKRQNDEFKFEKATMKGIAEHLTNKLAFTAKQIQATMGENERLQESVAELTVAQSSNLSIIRAQTRDLEESKETNELLGKEKQETLDELHRVQGAEEAVSKQYQEAHCQLNAMQSAFNAKTAQLATLEGQVENLSCSVDVMKRSEKNQEKKIKRMLDELSQSRLRLQTMEQNRIRDATLIKLLKDKVKYLKIKREQLSFMLKRV